MTATTKAEPSEPNQGSGYFGPLQLRVTLLCALIALLDGFDTQILAYVAPRIADDWGLAPADLATALAAGPLGLAVGAFALSPLADRIGRKPVIILSTLLFGFFALVTVYAQTLSHLVALRFLTGIGLGAAMPNIIALTGEFAPVRLRATLITLMFGGLPLGSAIGGFLSNWLMNHYDWHAVFLVGGVLPLLLVPVLWFWLPESPGLMIARNQPLERINTVLGQMDPGLDRQAYVQAIRLEQGKAAHGFSVAGLFADGCAGLTLLVWTIYFANLLAMYFLVNWLPTLLRDTGLALEMAIVSTAMLNVGGALGGVAFGWLLDRYNAPLVLGCGYVVAVLAIAAMALAGAHVGALLLAASVAGFTVVGVQTGCHVVTSSVYPAALRATGLGWALGVGRIGAIIGPLVGGALLAAQWAPHDIILMAVVPSLVALAALLGLKRQMP